MAPKVSGGGVSQANVGKKKISGGVSQANVGKKKISGGCFKRKAHRIIGYQWGRALEENVTLAQIQEVPSTFSLHGLFGKKITNINGSKKFVAKPWDSTILSESFKFCLRERWPNCLPNDSRTDPKKHIDHHTDFWNLQYSKHYPDVMMNQKEFLLFAVNQFNSVRLKLNKALNESCGRPFGDFGRRKLNVKKFLKRLKPYGLFPSIHVRPQEIEVPGIKELKEQQLLTEVRLYFDHPTDKPINPPHGRGNCILSKPVFVA